MLKRLKLLGTSSVQKKLAECKIDKTHDMVSFNIFNDFIEFLSNQRHSKQLFQKLHNNISSTSNTLKIKSLILLHFLVKKTFNQKLIQFVQQQCTMLQVKLAIPVKIAQGKENPEKQIVRLQNQQREYIQKNIIHFYVIYLKKFIAYQESYEFAKKQDENDKKIKKQVSVIQFKEENYFLQCINHGFKILNLINFVLQSQESFNKMGRYYLQQYQVISLFVMYLSDLTIYNGFIKNLSKRIIKFINQVQSQRIKHCFLFLTEAQKISDRLYEFHYNRYYYAIIKKFIMMPTFLTIENQEFDKVVKEIKKVDKELFLLVKQSKYSNNNSRLNQTCLTEHRRNSSIDKGMNKTMMTQPSQRKESSEWQNITKYIEQVQEIDQIQQQI